MNQLISPTHIEEEIKLIPNVSPLQFIQDDHLVYPQSSLGNLLLLYSLWPQILSSAPRITLHESAHIVFECEGVYFIK